MVYALLLVAAVAADPVKVEVGKPAPDFTVAAANISSIQPDRKDAKEISLKDLKGKNVVLYFYPKAMTPGCTKESCGFRDNLKALADNDTVVIGISTDKIEDQVKFIEKEKLTFPLIADTDKSVTKSFGVLNAARGVPSRATFIIDKKGVVRKIYNPVGNAEKHPAEVLEYVKTELNK